MGHAMVAVGAVADTTLVVTVLVLAVKLRATREHVITVQPVVMGNIVTDAVEVALGRVRLAPGLVLRESITVGTGGRQAPAQRVGATVLFVAYTWN